MTPIEIRITVEYQFKFENSAAVATSKINGVYIDSAARERVIQRWPKKFVDLSLKNRFW